MIIESRMAKQKTMFGLIDIVIKYSSFSIKCSAVFFFLFFFSSSPKIENVLIANFVFDIQAKDRPFYRRGFIVFHSNWAYPWAYRQPSWVNMAGFNIIAKLHYESQAD